MLPNVVLSESLKLSPSEPSRRQVLAHEARRIARRRSVATGVARRGRSNDRNLPDDASAAITQRAIRRASLLGIAFHRTIDSLWAAGEFDEAMAICRDHQADLSRRSTNPARPD